MPERGCLNCKWAWWRKPPVEDLGKCMFEVPGVMAAILRLPMSVTIQRHVLHRQDPYTDCPTWEARR